MELAIAGAIEQNAAIIISIGKKIVEARRFRHKCLALDKDAKILQETLKKNKEAIDELRTLADFKQCLTDIEAFAASCRDWSALDVGLEVFVKHRFPALKERIRRLMGLFSYEVNIVTLAHQKTQNDNILKDLRRCFDDERRRAVTAFVSDRAPPLQADFTLGDTRLALTFEQGVDMVGRISQVGRGTLEGVGTIICTMIEPSSYTGGYLKIYQGIQGGAGVQTFHGTLDANGKLYAVMDNLDGELTLHQACKSNVQLSAIERLGIAYDLAKTVAWFHKAEICLKSLNDLTIVLKKLHSNKWYPILVGLERSRLFLVKTDTMDYDCRYEAPEFQHMQEHTPSSDIWSLGTIIWQCISGKYPFDEPTFVHPKVNLDKAQNIRSRLSHNRYPGSLDTVDVVHGLSYVIRQCWRQRGDLRPTSADVVLMMQKLYISATITPPARFLGTDNREKAEVIQLRLMEDIQRARKLNPPGVKVDLDVPLNLQVTNQEFEEFYFSDDEWDSVKSYVVGAALFWKLVELSVDESSIDDPPPQQSLIDPTQKRCFLALKHLNSAAQTGYNEAYLEIWRAHAVLARLYKAGYDERHLPIIQRQSH